MAAFSFDASGIVKRYINEIGTGWVQSLADPAASHELFLTRIGRVEVVSAITRRGRGRVIPVSIATAHRLRSLRVVITARLPGTANIEKMALRERMIVGNRLCRCEVDRWSEQSGGKGRWRE
jgi:hypothetical protein